MLERELRKVCYFKSFERAKAIFKKIIEKTPYTAYQAHFLDSFRVKFGRVEYKRVLSRHAYYYDRVWFQYVVSREISYDKWPLSLHKKFILPQSVVTEYRLEVEPSPATKFYAFKRTDGKCGLAFETEDYRHLKTYSKFYRCLARQCILQQQEQQESSPSTKYLCRRTVLHGTCAKDCFVAPKYDGIFGYVLFYSDGFISEKWEDGESKIIRHREETVASYPRGLAFSAERLASGTVVLLDVLSVGDMPTYRRDVRHILGSFMRDLEKRRRLRLQTSLPSNYLVQKYRDVSSGGRPPDVATEATDGVIYHTFDDIVFKSKFINTVELYYENGLLRSFSQSFIPAADCGIEYVEGGVYECQLVDEGSALALCRRKDRFVCNSDEQIANAMSKKN